MLRTLSAGLLLGCVLSGTAVAADHAEAPIAGADPAADIADFYAWENGAGQTYAIVTFAGLTPDIASGGAATYDADVLYGVHIDNDDDGVADINIWVRYGTDSLGNWGVQVENLPGTGAPVAGPVEQVVGAAGGMFWTGLRDDPFFFDLEGYESTLTTGTVDMINTRDSLAGANVTAIVLGFDTAAAADGAATFTTWATTARITP